MTKTPRLNPRVIRPGDKVVLVEAKAVERVGYPKSMKQYQLEVADAASPEISQLITKALGAALPVGAWTDARDRIIREVAYVRARLNKFGGNKRDIFFRPINPEWAGKGYRVTSMHTVATGWREEGHYYPPSYDEMWGEYEPPSFGIEKVWRLASLDLPVLEEIRPAGWRIDYSKEIWIPVDFLKKVDATVEPKGI